MHGKFRPLLLLILLVVISLLVPSCTAQENDSPRILQIKENPDLGGSLKQLIIAYEFGMLEKFKRNMGSDIDLRDDNRVLVELRCEKGMAAVVSEVLIAMGIEEVLYSARMDLVEGIVPIDDIEGLLDIPGVTHVSLPVYASHE